jgi:hypothetical protein
MVKGHLTCFPLAAAQSLGLQYAEDFRRSHRLNNNDWKQATQATNKIVH